jgi:nitrogen fixation protein NifU and related proteins
LTEAQEILLENYKNPQHFGEPLFKATHSASVLNPFCGDEITLWCSLDIDGLVADISFNAQGCSIAIASASLLYSYI